MCGQICSSLCRLPPFSGMLHKTGSLHPWLGCGHVHDLMGVSPERQEVL